MTGLGGRLNIDFSGEGTVLKGDFGKVRELADRGESTVDGTDFCEMVRVAFGFGAIAVLTRFFGLLGRS